MPVVLDKLWSIAALGTGQRGWGQHPLWPSGTGPTCWERVCSRGLIFLLAQDSKSKISAGALGSDSGKSAVLEGQAEIIYELSFPFLSLFMLVSLLGFLIFFFPPWSYLLFLFQTGANCLTCGNKQQLQPGLIFHSHTFYFLCSLISSGAVCSVVSWGLEMSHVQHFWVTHFRVSVTKGKAREKLWQKRYTWIGNTCTYFSVVAII